MNGRSELADEKTEWLRRFHVLYIYSWGLLRSNVQLNESQRWLFRIQMQIIGWRFVTYDNLAGRPARQEVERKAV